MSRCVDSYPEGLSAWKYGVGAFFIQVRGIILILLLSVATMGSSPWWLPDDITIWQTIQIPTVAVIITLSLFLISGLVYLRKRTIRSLEIKALLHNFSHYLRDCQSNIFKRTILQNDLFDKEDSELYKFSDYMDKICEYIRDYFVLMTHDSTVNCAIRIAVEDDKPNNKGARIVYRTLGRSSGLSSTRAETTEDIPSNRGIPRYLNDEQNCKGILRYNDLQEASQLGVFKITANEQNFPDEIKTMFVAPMNGWDGKSHSMVGLLYVTSRNNNVFRRKHVDCMRFVADMVASSVCFTVQRITDQGLVKNIRRSKS